MKIGCRLELLFWFRWTMGDFREDELGERRSGSGTPWIAKLSAGVDFDQNVVRLRLKSVKTRTIAEFAVPIPT